MTGPGEVTYEERALQGLAVPGHVFVLTGAGWRPGWLIARAHGSGGWTGLVQYEGGRGEITEYLAADHIASPDTWVASDPAALAE
ncbi:hypothetical protein JOF29_001115 [Kribbella aluminosa]|uniref:Uncharacterized protein n=1 Tax=Kribbella aluminosa TaxID=416017 RepID=A0ABS4UEG8_9ACTN|nr:hypothetical protein [Kribbella aluminosa]MBP2350032.1 hypothetical protein [Kribbella aluminosa]